MFKFKLETLFKVRKRNKDIIYKKWSSELGTLQKIHHEKNKIISDHRKNKELYVAALDKDSNEEAQLLRVFIDTFKVKLKVVENKIDLQQQVIDGLREEMMKVSQDFEIISKLKEKKFKEYKEDLRVKENKYNDELSILKGKRGSKIGSI